MLDDHQVSNGKLLQVVFNYYGYKQNLACHYATNQDSAADIDCIFLLGGEPMGSLGSTENGNRSGEIGGARREWLTPLQFEPFSIFHGIRRAIKILSEAHLDDGAFL